MFSKISTKHNKLEQHYFIQNTNPDNFNPCTYIYFAVKNISKYTRLILLKSEQVSHWSTASFPPLSLPLPFSSSLLLLICTLSPGPEEQWWLMGATSRGCWSSCNHRSIINGKAFIMETLYLQTALHDSSCRGCNWWGRCSETQTSLPVKKKITQTM